ncbi:putative alkane 1-monooxygenase [Helianthus annuus]|nr:putative alkane 1-monooxygenase [Helianthus annuus]KAJ0483102.1 putative alkane 1-monooxygenase [Helianthus annuus]KAJ0499247.1 putative alkane 1-monooxygenase [Helianthus annuus]KAJ0665262.1 putative alkane 1-monooxygenase [Helianthus annuus]KAJ0665267.1 putative alkane 1-monooxygenase [Helianthus annuus]
MCLAHEGMLVIFLLYIKDLSFSFSFIFARFFNIGSERKYKEAIETVNEFAMEVIKSKETQIGDKTNEDLLSRFMASSWDMGFEDEERRKFLRDIIISFILAGKDSTSTALTWFFWLLDGHPHCKHMIHKEISMLMTSTHHIHVGYRPLNTLAIHSNKNSRMYVLLVWDM